MQVDLQDDGARSIFPLVGGIVILLRLAIAILVLLLLAHSEDCSGEARGGAEYPLIESWWISVAQEFGGFGSVKLQYTAVVTDSCICRKKKMLFIHRNINILQGKNEFSCASANAWGCTVILPILVAKSCCYRKKERHSFGQHTEILAADLEHFAIFQFSSQNSKEFFSALHPRLA
ncbi:hypothetical protein K1719_030387 [Acacia pycnantha]|nr:hypothetical protein K1719_030387 [Acacia pycnantha]